MSGQQSKVMPGTCYYCTISSSSKVPVAVAQAVESNCWHAGGACQHYEYKRYEYPYLPQELLASMGKAYRKAAGKVTR